MGDRLKKMLSRLSPKERKKIVDLIECIVAGHYTGMDLKKLKGHTGTYRVRKGDIRIIFTQKDEEDIRIIALERRTNTTYSKF